MSWRRTKLREESGFTLIELLVVIAIIAFFIPELQAAIRSIRGCEEEPERVTFSGNLQAVLVAPEDDGRGIRVALHAEGITGTRERGGSYRLVGAATTNIAGDSEEATFTVPLRVIGTTGEGDPVNQPTDVATRISVDQERGELNAEVLRAEPEDPCDDDRDP
ncbi:MAG: prepilin-type N-terminal cleavage/methylation domain-containing protein [Actinomycetota bacterium]